LVVDEGIVRRAAPGFSPFPDAEMPSREAAMPRRSEFVEHVVETMRAFGPVEARPMFGGWGLYHGGVFFALVAEDALYLKVDDETRARFEDLGLEPFVYDTKDGSHSMSYFQAPEEALETPHVMTEWARLAYGAALRAAARKKSGKKPAAKAPAKPKPKSLKPAARPPKSPRRS
jgi:DNA transformation protein and related proteins